MLKYTLLFFSIISSSTLFSQKKLPNKGIGLTATAMVFYFPKDNYLVAHPIPQIQFVYLPQPNTITKIAVGSIASFDDEGQFFPLNHIWFTANYLCLHRYNKKKKAKFIYGGRLDVGVGRFAYASEHVGVGVKSYYKRLLVGLSPQAGVWLKSGKRNFFTATLSTGVSSLFLKITQAPKENYHYRVIIPIGLQVEYNFLFKRKRR